MNKSDVAAVMRAIEKVKICVLGKIEADINSRLPKKPRDLDSWDKYCLIRDGKATLITNFKARDLLDRFSHDKMMLSSAFTYPISPEQAAYTEAHTAIQAEKADRELAVELAFNRVADECILGLIDRNDFLNTIEKMANQVW